MRISVFGVIILAMLIFTTGCCSKNSMNNNESKNVNSSINASESDGSKITEGMVEEIRKKILYIDDCLESIRPSTQSNYGKVIGKYDNVPVKEVLINSKPVYIKDILEKVKNDVTQQVLEEELLKRNLIDINGQVGDIMADGDTPSFIDKDSQFKITSMQGQTMTVEATATDDFGNESILVYVLKKDDKGNWIINSITTKTVK